MKRKTILLISFILLLIAMGYLGLQLFGNAFANTKLVEVRVRKNWTLEHLASEMEKTCGFNKRNSFLFWAPKLGYENVRPCFIQIQPGTSLFECIKLLRTQRNQTRNIVIKPGISKETFIQAVISKIEVDRDSLEMALSGKLVKPGMLWTDTNWYGYIIPNTYNFYVKDDLADLVAKLNGAYKSFWTNERIRKVKAQLLTPMQAAIIASIVCKESNYVPEFESIAGVYINRLRKGMLLQADPTIVFIRTGTGRVKLSELKIESPYNTYLHKGLPPGPICIPGTESIDAVLHYNKHNFFFFVAKPDGSGTHDFSATWDEHKRKAAALHRILEQQKVK